MLRFIQLKVLAFLLLFCDMVMCIQCFDAIGWAQKGHPTYKKNSVIGCWHGYQYLSGARCRFVYGPADATATQCFLLPNQQRQSTEGINPVSDSRGWHQATPLTAWNQRIS